MRGRTKSYRFNDQFDIKTSFPQKKKKKKEPVTSNRRRKLRGRRVGVITNFQFKVLPADSPSPQLHKTGLEKNCDRGVEGGANEKEPKTNSSPFTLNTCRNRPRHFFLFFFLKNYSYLFRVCYFFFPFVLTQSVKTAAVDLQLR